MKILKIILDEINICEHAGQNWNKVLQRNLSLKSAGVYMAV